MIRRWLFLCLILSMGANAAQAVTTLRRGTTASSGADAVATQHRLRATLAQPVAGKVAATQHTLHAGFWWPGQFTTGADDDLDMPREFALTRISPNPFSRSTEIRYDAPLGGGAVSMRIYDVRGRLVRTLLRGAVTGGAHRLAWDGLDDAGHRAGGGFYLLRFEAPGRRVTRKLIMLP